MAVDEGAHDPGALVLHRTVAEPAAAVLVLHGGRAHGLDTPSPWNLAAARMRPFLTAVARATAGAAAVVGTVRYRHRGWNGERGDAAQDAQRALDALHRLTGPVPVVLVGHSMGGRAALRAGGSAHVAGVVGLAPWCPSGEPVDHLHGRRVVLLHGDRDRMTDPLGSRALAVRAREAGAQACHLTVRDGDHAMLRRAGVWHALTAHTVSALLGHAPLPDPVARGLARHDVPEPGGDAGLLV